MYSALELPTSYMFLHLHLSPHYNLFHFLLARYRYVVNAPGSSAKRSTSADSKASSAKSSSPSSSWRCCHGSMFSQLVRAAVHQKPTFRSCLPAVRQGEKNSPTAYCGAPEASRRRAGASPRRTSHPASGGRLAERRSPRLDL